MPGWVQAGLPEFVVEDFKSVFGERWAEEARELMAPRAPIDLRVNSERATVDEVAAELAEVGLKAEPTPFSAWGLRLPSEPPPNIQTLDAFREGCIEIQDEGSQIVSWLAGARPGVTVVDYCAGGGGKTLALAQAMQGQGALVACDVVPKRLENIRPRLARAGVEADLRLLGQNGGGAEDLNGQADLVFVDAPCSGSGTWRRRPEDAWRLTAEEVERLHALQVRILGQAAQLVKPGGRLVYVTCSMLSRENEATTAAFEAAHPGFRPLPIPPPLGEGDHAQHGGGGGDRMRSTTPQTPFLRQVPSTAKTRSLSPDGGGTRLRLSPASTHTDGFFFAAYERTS